MIAAKNRLDITLHKDIFKKRYYSEKRQVGE